MTCSTLQHFPMKSAYLCQDCNSIGNSSVQCPACASQALLGLSTVLDREAIVERTSIAIMRSSKHEPLLTMAA